MLCDWFSESRRSTSRKDKNRVGSWLNDADSVRSAGPNDSDYPSRWMRVVGGRVRRKHSREGRRETNSREL